jgi:hypothetical protein
MAATAGNILASLRHDFDAFKREATEIRETLADAQGAYYFMSLYALLMGVFSQVDLYAAPGRPIPLAPALQPFR